MQTLIYRQANNAHIPTYHSTRQMGNHSAVVVVLLLIPLLTSWAVLAVAERRTTSTERERPREEERRYDERREQKEEEYDDRRSRGLFLLGDESVIAKTEAGMVKVVKGDDDDIHTWTKASSRKMHVGVINMKPNTLFLPQYMDAHLILFVKSGGVKVGFIFDDEYVEKNLTVGDIYRIAAGSVFFMANTDMDQELRIICSIDPSESSGSVPFQSFFVGGGIYPKSVLSGFDKRTLSTALNVTVEELGSILGRQRDGPIIYMRSEKEDESARLGSIMRVRRRERYNGAEDEILKVWTWRKLLNAMLGKEVVVEVVGENVLGSTANAPDAYNIYDTTPDFKNDYGWTSTVDENTYEPLKTSGIGIYLVNLTAGSMLAPHLNPMATEYGVVLSGSGTLQVVFPNGSSAMNVEVNEGDTFYIPRYFPFCQIAARTEQLEFFGFTTSAHQNNPQFLVGAGSILNTMMGPELAEAFSTDEDKLQTLFSSQSESIILPSRERRKEDDEEQEPEESILIKEMVV